MRCQNCRGFAPDDVERCPYCGEPLAIKPPTASNSSWDPPLLGNPAAGTEPSSTDPPGGTSQHGAAPPTTKPEIYPWQEGPSDVRGGAFQRLVSWTMGHLWGIAGAMVLLILALGMDAVRHSIGGFLDIFWGLLAWLLAVNLVRRRGLPRVPVGVILGVVGTALWVLGFRALSASISSSAVPEPVVHPVGTSPSVPGVSVRTVDVTITGNRPWVATPVYLEPGEVVKITATGIINNGSIYPQVANNSPAGHGVVTANGGCTAAVTPQHGYIAPGFPCWSLIGRIGSGAPFEVGTQRSFTTPVAGVLFLGADNNTFGTSTGSWSVAITVSGRL